MCVGNLCSGLDGQSLYCTEVLPSSSPPSQPITVEGGGTNRRGQVSVNGGANSQPVQYTIIIADPQLQQNGSSSRSITSGATNILLNTLVQQQQLQQQQQQLQHHLVSISKANSTLNNLIASSNASVFVNSNNLNGSYKCSNLLSTGVVTGNSNNVSGNSNNVSGSNNNTSAFPANLIANSLNNNNVDGKSISISLPHNSKLPAAVFDSGSAEGGILIFNYTDSGDAGTATLANINQLVSVHGHDFVAEGSNPAPKAVSDKASVISTDNWGTKQSHSYVAKPDTYQLSSGIRLDARSSAVYNGPVIEKEGADYQRGSTNGTSHLSPPVQSGERQLQEVSSASERLSGGMHSGRIGGAGSGQGHSNHQQQQRQSPNGTPTSSAAASSQSTMLSAGQPAVPSSAIFRTGADNSSPPHRLSGSNVSGYTAAQYSTIYGMHGQAPAHLTNMQPYSTFFPAFGGSGTSSHVFSHGSLMTAAPQSHYPVIESYSAMLASMGSQVQHRGVQGADRSPRMPAAPSGPVTQRPFLPSTPHLVAPGTQYSASCRRLSGSNSPSPGVQTCSPQTTPAVSSHHLDKMASIKGGHQARDIEASMDLRLYGDVSGIHEEKSSLSPSSPYGASGHVPKVSFDNVVKEYGGRDSPSGRGDLYYRTSLSGKEGSLKHRILTRPSDSELPDDMSKVSGVHGLKDEPASKRPKVSSMSLAPVSYGQHGDSQRPGAGRHQTLSHPAARHSPINSNTNLAVESRGPNSGHHPDNVSGHQGESLTPYQHGDDSRYKPQAYHHTPSPSWSSPPSSPSCENPSSHLQYPSHFMKGSIIQLADGTLKRVEDLQTDDFVSSAEISSDLKVDSSTVVRIEENQDRGTAMLSFSVGEHRVQVTVEATLEHPFFVFGQGWSSCSVTRTLARYGLDCQKLNVGDVCISLTHKDVNLKAAEISQQQQQEQSYIADQSGPTAAHSAPIPMSATSASSSILTSQSSNISSGTSSMVSSSLKVDSVDKKFLPPHHSSGSSSNKRRLSQTELPPPQSNIVPVKKESNNNSLCSRRRGSALRQGEGEVKEEEEPEDEDEDSTSLLRQRRWSAPDPVTVKADQERERERQMLANEAQKAEESLLGGGGDNNGHH
ncbi:unnamed protein product [Lymnaea stagnalis]|uniref:AXH domain-containing protein n=1 Tax=Lymnaea stagnalis TaxID=6523 RepID=A0AAV2HYU4_LYMST